MDNPIPEPKPRKWVRFLLGGAAAAWIIALLSISFSMSGTITLTGAYWVLGIAWGGAVILFYFSEATWEVSAKFRRVITVIVALILGILLFWVGCFEKAHAPSAVSATRQALWANIYKQAHNDKIPENLAHEFEDLSKNNTDLGNPTGTPIKLSKGSFIGIFEHGTGIWARNITQCVALLDKNKVISRDDHFFDTSTDLNIQNNVKDSKIYPSPPKKFYYPPGCFAKNHDIMFHALGFMKTYCYLNGPEEIYLMFEHGYIIGVLGTGDAGGIGTIVAINMRKGTDAGNWYAETVSESPPHCER